MTTFMWGHYGRPTTVAMVVLVSILLKRSGGGEVVVESLARSTIVQLSSDMAGNNHCKLLRQMYISQSTYQGIIRCLLKVEIDFVCTESRKEKEGT